MLRDKSQTTVQFALVASSASDQRNSARLRRSEILTDPDTKVKNRADTPPPEFLAGPRRNTRMHEQKHRSLWNREQIAEGVALLEKALKSRCFGAYTLQGCDCSRSCGGGIGRCNRLASDRGALRSIATNSPFASCTAKSCRG